MWGTECLEFLRTGDWRCGCREAWWCGVGDGRGRLSNGAKSKRPESVHEWWPVGARECSPESRERLKKLRMMRCVDTVWEM